MFGISKAPDDATKLTEQLQSCSTVSGFDELRGAIEKRRQWIRDRRHEIGGHGQFAGPARLAAEKKGLTAAQALEKESEDLDFEWSFLDRIEQLAVVGSKEAEVAQLRKTIPAARGRLSREVQAVKDAAAGLAAAVAKLNATMDPLLNYQDAGVPFPLSDEQVAELLEVRELVWTVYNVHTMLPALPDEDGERSDAVKRLPLAYCWLTGGRWKDSEGKQRESVTYRPRVRLTDPRGLAQSL